MRTEYAPVGVHLINDNELQVAKKVRPIGVMGQDSGVEHIRVGKDNMGILADCRPVGLGCFAIVNARFQGGQGVSKRI